MFTLLILVDLYKIIMNLEKLIVVKKEKIRGIDNSSIWNILEKKIKEYK